MSEPETNSASAGPPSQTAASENVSVKLKKLRVSRIRRLSESAAEAVPESRQPSEQADDEDDLSRCLWRLHVAAGPLDCPCGRRSPAGDRRRPLLLRPARLKPSRRPLLRESRLLRAASRRVFGAAAPQRCCEFARLAGDESVPAAAPLTPVGATFADAGAPVFGPRSRAPPPADEPPPAPTTACSLQHRQRRPTSVDQLAGLVAQVAIMSSMAEMMYT